MVEAQFKVLLHIVARPANQTNVADIHESPALDFGVDAHLPAAHQALHERAGTTHEPPALAERQVVDDVGLELVGEVPGRPDVTELTEAGRDG